jgi:uncharacterized membrane protein
MRENTNLQETNTVNTENESAGNEKTVVEFLTDKTKNVSDTERAISAACGAALIAYGIQRKDWLGALLSVAGGALALRGATGHCQVYDALDVDTNKKPLFGGKSSSKSWLDAQTEVVKSVTINKSPAELYDFWRNFENLPRFMNHLESVKVLDEKRSEWTAKAPLGTRVSWNAVISEDVRNERIAWTSYGESDVKNSGRVEFLPTVERGTEVKVTIRYEPPAGALGKIAAYFLTEEPETQVTEDLRRFKRLMETGEIITVEGQTSGRAAETKPKAAKASA